MTHSNDNTLARKGKHLSYAERVQIAVLKKEDYSNRCIADVIGRVPQTINNEIQQVLFLFLNVFLVITFYTFIPKKNFHYWMSVSMKIMLLLFHNLRLMTMY